MCAAFFWLANGQYKIKRLIFLILKTNWQSICIMPTCGGRRGPGPTGYECVEPDLQWWRHVLVNCLRDAL